jgi:hypothetical protein
MNERPESRAEREWRQFTQDLLGREVESLDLVSVEREIQARLHALGAELCAEVLRKADTTAAELEVDGQRWGNRRESVGTYVTVFGLVELRRSIYQQAGRGKVLVPVDARLGIVEGRYTPRMARVATRLCAVMTDEEGADLLAEVGTAQMSKSTLSRLPRAMAARYEQHRDVIEANVREQEPIAVGAVTVQVSLDGVMVPQDGEHARPRGRKADAPDLPRHEQRYGSVGSPGPAANDGTMGRAWHEGSVGTVAYFDEEGQRLATTYLARMPEPGKAGLVEQLEAELTAALREQPSLNVVYASDGAAPQWKALDAMAKRAQPATGGTTMHLVDAFHVAEYVKKAANAIFGTEGREAHVHAATWRETLKTEGGASVVLRSMRARMRQVPTTARRKELASAIGYVKNQSDAGRMDYAAALAKHFPIGTGITEAAAKTLVGTRMKRAGARFSQHGGQTVMTFRAAILSHRFDALHRELGATYRKDVKIAA